MNTAFLHTRNPGWILFNGPGKPNKVFLYEKKTKNKTSLIPYLNKILSALTFGSLHIQLSTPYAAQRWSCAMCPLPSGSKGPQPLRGSDIPSQRACGTKSTTTESVQSQCKQVHTVAGWLMKNQENEGFWKNQLTQWTTRRESLTGRRHPEWDTDSATD